MEYALDWSESVWPGLTGRMVTMALIQNGRIALDIRPRYWIQNEASERTQT